MNAILKYTLTAAVTGAVALAAISPGQARDGRNAAAAVGFGAGAVAGAAIASSANNGYYYGPGYYAAEPAYVNDQPAYAYEPAPRYYRSYRGNSCVTDGGYGRPDYGAC